MLRAKMKSEDDDELMTNETPQDEVIEDPNIEAASVPVEPGSKDQSEAVASGEEAPKVIDPNDRYLRLAAEFENHRKRTAREWSDRR